MLSLTVCLVALVAPSTAQLFACSDTATLYTVDVASLTATKIGVCGNGRGALAPFTDGNLLSMNNNNELVVVAADGTGIVKNLGTFGSAFDIGLAFAADTGTAFTSDGGNFASFDVASGTVTTLANGIDDIEALAYSEARQAVFGVDEGLYKYDIVAKSWSQVGVDFPNFDFEDGGLAYDDINDVLYAFDDDYDLYSIDPDTGVLTLLGKLSGDGIDTESDYGLAFLSQSNFCKSESPSGSICISADGKVTCGECPPGQKKRSLKAFTEVAARFAIDFTIKASANHPNCAVQKGELQLNGQAIVIDRPVAVAAVDSSSSSSSDGNFAIPDTTGRRARGRVLLLPIGEQQYEIVLRSMDCAKNQVIATASATFVGRGKAAIGLETSDSSSD